MHLNLIKNSNKPKINGDTSNMASLAVYELKNQLSIFKEKKDNGEISLKKGIMGYIIGCATCKYKDKGKTVTMYDSTGKGIPNLVYIEKPGYYIEAVDFNNDGQLDTVYIQDRSVPYVTIDGRQFELEIPLHKGAEKYIYYR